MARKNVSSGSDFEDQIGYSRAVVKGNWIFVSGTTGYDYDTMCISDDIVEQTKQCFVNIIKVLEQVDSSLNDVVRVTYILPHANQFKDCWPVLKEYFSEIKPAATMFSAGLANDKMKIEIQVTALKE
ncbi:RidA family protein [Tamlana agarivorans]|uniref:RidA family protein n=1 Tax=Pseudotamlana agarivorans TaxID=481183 RepID=A0ACC5UB08_9FLAO|nr:RidA family protein [Tamlana agarivorans]MBU2951523.1 RidA family protein [Tamlana agarivorans]